MESIYNWRIELLNIGKDYGLSLTEINAIIDFVSYEYHYHTNLYNIKYGLLLMSEIFERKLQNE